MITIDGLVSGIDTASIVEGLTEVQQRQLETLTERQNGITERQTAFKGVEAGLLRLRSSLGRLSRVQQNVLQTRQVTSSDELKATASAKHGAPVGVYTIQIDSLARAHQMASSGFAGNQSEITQGSLSIRVGGATAVDVVIDETNNSLEGLAEAINSADAGVTASIINDGSGATPYRLLLTGSKTGAVNTIEVVNNLADASGGAVKPDFSGPAIQEAADAALKIGSGPGAIDVTSASNQVEDVIPGVTLNLINADPGNSIAITVARDSAAAEDAISGFVESYNSLMEFIDDQSRYNADTSQAGLLLGNRSTIAVQDDVRAAVTDVVLGVNQNMNRLSAIGITVNDLGRLVLDSGRLNDALNGRVEGVSDRDVQRLFSLDGTSSSSHIEFIAGSTRTSDSQTPIEIDITQAARQATVLGSTALAASTVIDGANNTLQLTVDGKQSSVLTLASGTYTTQQLTEHLEAVIGADAELLGRSVSVGIEGGNIRITSDAFGSSSEIQVDSGTALGALGLAGGESDTGRDVVGRFIVNGEVETAVGRGRTLTGDADNTHTADLQLKVTLAESQITAGNEGTLTITRGIASRLDKVISGLVDPVSGRIKTANDRFDASIEDIQKTIDKQSEVFDARRAQLIREFVAMESAISQLRSQSNALAAQLGSLPAVSAPSALG